MGRSIRISVGVAVGLFVVVVAAAGVYLWNRISSPLLLDAPAPRVLADPPDTGARVPASTVEARVTYNLATAIDSLEAAVPRTYGDIGRRLPIASNKRASFAYLVRRSPFRVHVSGRKLSISAVVEYEGRVWYRPPIGPELSAGCGTGRAPRPRVRVTLESTASLTPRWELRAHTRVLRLESYSDEPRDRCRLTLLRIDVTDRVIEATRHMLDEELREFDASVSRWPVRARFLRLWDQLQRPIFLTQGVYLEINPYAAQLGPVGAVGDTVSARLQLIASPRVVTGLPHGEFRQLPLLRQASNVDHAAHVAVEAAFTYPVATTLLRHALVGRSSVQRGHRIRIRDVKLTGIGGGRVALAVMLAGHVHGTLYFTGTPGFDRVHHQVNVPDLDYDVGNAQQLVQGYAWLEGVDIREFLRARARLPDSAVVGKLRGLAEHGINRTLARGVTLSGRIRDARGTSVRATTQAIRLRAVADAWFKLAIDRAPKVPRPPSEGARSGGTRPRRHGPTTPAR